MSVLDMFKHRRSVPANAAFRLTQEGTDKLQNYSGDPDSRILVALQTRGSCDLNEISQTSGLGRGLVEKTIPRLLRKGYVSYVNSGSGGDGFEE